MRFRESLNTSDPVLCLQDEIREAQENKETIAALLFDVVKRGALIGNRENLCNKELSNQYVVENRTFH